MIARLVKTFISASSADAEDNELSRTLSPMIRNTLVVVVILGVFLVASSSRPVITLVFIGFAGLSLLLVLFFLWMKQARAAGLWFALSIWLGMNLIAGGLHGGLNSPLIDSYLMIIIAIGLALGGRSGIFFAFLGLVSILGLFGLGRLGWLPEAVVPVTEERRLIFHLMNFLLAALLMKKVSSAMQEALARARRHERDLTEKNRELEGIRTSLEERIARRTEEILQQKQYFETLFLTSPLAIVTLDLDHRVVSCNPAFERLFGYSKREVIGQELDSLVAGAGTLDEAHGYTQQVLSGESIHRLGLRRCKDGRLVDVEIYGVPVRVGDRQVGIVGLYHDVTEERRAEAALLAAKEHAELLYRVTPSAIFTVDVNRIVTSFNATAAEITGYSAAEVIGKPCTIFAHQPCSGTCGLFSGDNSKVFAGVECEILTKNGGKRFIMKNAELLRDPQGEIIGGIESFADITDRKRAEEFLHHLAMHDALTVLPNRTLFYQRLNQSLRMARPGQLIAVMFLDMDGFKGINDTFGHAIGDVLLQMVADRMKSHLRASDTVARLGGDEFAFIFDNVNKTEDAAQIARKILDSLAEPFNVDEQQLTVTASIGISLSPQDGTDADSLVNSADAAMYRAKEAGKNGFLFYSQQNTPLPTGDSRPLPGR